MIRRPMHFMAVPLSVFLMIGAPLVGCASDPNKEVKSAQNDEVEAARKRDESAAAQRSEMRENRAEAMRERRDERAEKYPSATGDRMQAQSKMAEMRDVFRAKATERLEKANARIVEVQRKLQIAGYRANLETRNSVDTAATQRTNVSQLIGQLPMVTDESWAASKKTIEKRLDELDALVDDASSKVNRL